MCHITLNRSSSIETATSVHNFKANRTITNVYYIAFKRIWGYRKCCHKNSLGVYLAHISYAEPPRRRTISHDHPKANCTPPPTDRFFRVRQPFFTFSTMVKPCDDAFSLDHWCQCKKNKFDGYEKRSVCGGV